MALTIDTDIDIRSTDNARQMQPMLGCRRCSRAVGVLRKSAGRKFVHCARVTKYFAFAAVGAVFGAVDLRGTAGDTLHVPQDHPPAREGVTQDMLVYDTNTTTFANPVYSRPFAPAAGDTVFYFLDGLIESPTDWPGDTTVMSLEDDTKMVAIPESVLFIVDVISHDDETVLEPLDSILYRPVNHFYELEEHSIEGFTVDSTIIDYFERNWVPDQYTGDMLRIRLRPVYVPQTRGDYSRRVLFVRFYWSPRQSVHYREYFRDYGVEKAPVKHLPVNRSDELHVTISPNVLERSRNVSLALEGEWIADEMVEITIYSIDGKVAWKGKHAPPVSTAATIHIAPDLHDVQAGVYFIMVRQYDRGSVRQITIM